MLLTAKGELNLSIKDVKPLLKIMTVRAWTAAMGTFMSMRLYLPAVSAPDSRMVYVSPSRSPIIVSMDRLPELLRPVG
jgi:hypothetical protein